MAKEAKEKGPPTEYVVLERLEVPSASTPKGMRAAWVEVGETDTAKAKSVNEAKIIKAVVGDREGAFKAVAKRAWKGGVKQAQTTIWKSEAIT